MEEEEEEEVVLVQEERVRLVRACVRAWGWVQTCWGETAVELMAFPRGDADQAAGSRHTTGQTFPSPSLCGWIARSREGDTKKHMRHV